jgi:hypothetical protein
MPVAAADVIVLMCGLKATITVRVATECECNRLHEGYSTELQLTSSSLSSSMVNHSDCTVLLYACDCTYQQM